MAGVPAATAHCPSQQPSQQRVNPVGELWAGAAHTLGTGAVYWRWPSAERPLFATPLARQIARHGMSMCIKLLISWVAAPRSWSRLQRPAAPAKQACSGDEPHFTAAPQPARSAAHAPHDPHAPPTNDAPLVTMRSLEDDAFRAAPTQSRPVSDAPPSYRRRADVTPVYQRHVPHLHGLANGELPHRTSLDSTLTAAVARAAEGLRSGTYRAVEPRLAVLIKVGTELSRLKRSSGGGFRQRRAPSVASSRRQVLAGTGKQARRGRAAHSDAAAAWRPLEHAGPPTTRCPGAGCGKNRVVTGCATSCATRNVVPRAAAAGCGRRGGRPEGQLARPAVDPRAGPRPGACGHGRAARLHRAGVRAARRREPGVAAARAALPRCVLRA